MVKRTLKTDRSCLVPAGCSTARIPFPPAPQTQQTPATGSSSSQPNFSTTSKETDGRSHQEGSNGEAESKISKIDGSENSALTSRLTVSWSCDSAGDVADPDQQGAAEDSRAAEVRNTLSSSSWLPSEQKLNGCAGCVQLQSAGSLKVTIQRSSESREFGQSDRGGEKKSPGLRCHVCDLSCHSLQVFQEHMSGGEHLRRLQEVTCRIRSYSLDRGRQTPPQRWCDTCQAHYTGNLIVHPRSTQHKMCKQQGRPFCPVCKRHFRTPRKFVEHMKSAEHKQQVQLEESQEEELITLDAVGCFEEEEEVEVAEEGQQGEDEEESEMEDSQMEEVNGQEHDPHVEYGGAFVVPVCGFVCRLCKKFFYGEAEARHSHCRTHTHFQNLQQHRAQTGNRDKEEKEETSGSPDQHHVT
ncbi:Cip1-interacting zinc finger protein [Oryzias melastigma]|uniref:Cip1-interacting zinc finger protein n=2 Tax=Oryzias melastigma TaxID=30732 RepID=A0A834C045_ORYME|nr:Cip1-interacting zinc finger protein [Oryzias melastigma]